MSMSRSTWTALLAIALFSPLVSGQEVGWRTDGSGAYPRANPPTQWSPDQNVAWSTKLPNWSNATPIIVGNRIFVCAEEATLICLDADNGEILWQRSNTYLDLLNEEERAKAEADLAAGDELLNKLKPIKRELRKARNKLKKSPDDEELKKKLRELSKQARALREKLQPLQAHRPKGTHPTNGYASPTPVSNGDVVAVLFGQGVAAVYDLEGNPVWRRLIEKAGGGWGHSASPTLAGDRLILQIRRVMRALDLKTGEELWKAPTNARWGSPITATLAGRRVVITPNGEIADVESGELLARNLAGLKYNAPIVDGDVVYFIQHDSKAYRVTADGDGGLTTEKLWESKIRNDRYYASPVLHNGLIYAITRRSVLSVLDAKTGERVYEQHVDLGKGTVYPSATLAGNYVFISSDNGTTFVLRPGRTYEVLAKNKLEQFRSNPVFKGDRMYVRTRTHLMCLEPPDATQARR